MTATLETVEAVALSFVLALFFATLPVVALVSLLWRPTEQAPELPAAWVVRW